jgi:exopolysaccharide production protein ExoZ
MVSAVVSTVGVSAADPSVAPDRVSEKNELVQGLRGVAALLVALYHATGYASAYLRGGTPEFTEVFDARFGVLGVAVFFAISGMLMAGVVPRTDPWRFLAHRIVRVYPLYLLALFVWLPICAALHVQSVGFHLLRLTLAPVGDRAYYLGGIEWTLIYECTYYIALFALARLGLQHRLGIVASVWLAAIALSPAVLPGFDPNSSHLAYFLLAVPNVAFAGGLLAPAITRNVKIFPPGLSLLAVAWFFLIGTHDLTTDRWFAGIVATLLVVDASRLKSTGIPFVPAKLGDWSYALYLFHIPCFLLVYKFWPPFGGTVAAWIGAVWVASLVGAVFGSLDVRLYRYLKSAADSAPEKRLRRLSNIYLGIFLVGVVVGQFYH